jgi:hypothetical protein
MPLSAVAPHPTDPSPPSAPSPAAAPRWWRLAMVLLPLLAALVPPYMVGRSVARYGVDVPVWDQWQFAGLVADAAEGRVDAGAFWAQHNEHRLVVPRLAMLALATASGWDVRWELAANLVVAGLTLLLLVVLLRDTVGRRMPVAVPVLVLVASCITFSPSQWENWMWGWQLQIYLAAFVAVTIAFVLSRWRGGWAGAIVLALLGCAGALCFASGAPMLVIVPAAILLHPQPRPPGRRLAQAAVALALGLSLLAAYLRGYARPGHHPPLLGLFAEPRFYLEYVAAYLGSALGLYDVWAAIYWGGFAVMFVALAGGLLVLRGDWPVLAPWAFLAVNAVGSAAITGIGRGRFGALQALQSRYVTISGPVWLCVAVVATLLLGRALRRGDGRSQVALATVVFVSALATLAAQGWARTWDVGARAMAVHHRELVENRDCLLDVDRAPEGCIARLFADTTLVRTTAHRLRGLGLGVFRPSSGTRAFEAYTVVGAAGAGGWLDRAAVAPTAPDRVRLVGWALDPATSAPPERVLVVADGRVVGVVETGEHRPDVVKATGKVALRRSGWTAFVPTWRLGPGRHRLAAYAIVGDGTELVPLDGGTEITLP